MSYVLMLLPSILAMSYNLKNSTPLVEFLTLFGYHIFMIFTNPAIVYALFFSYPVTPSDECVKVGSSKEDKKAESQ
jgi:hypothetical protein